MGNVYMEADQVRFKDSTYRNVQEGLTAALEGGGGTTVVANPEASATADLTKLQVGEGVYGIPTTAAKISYDNTDSGLTADDVQEAIDEVAGNVTDLQNANKYLTTETLVGKWGSSDLYRKCINIGALPNNTSGTYDLGLTTETIRRLEFYYDKSDDFGTIWNQILSISYNKTNNRLEVVTDHDLSAYSGAVIVEYTKAS